MLHYNYRPGYMYYDCVCGKRFTYTGTNPSMMLILLMNYSVSKGVKPTNKIGSINPGEVVKISKVVGAWGRLLNKKNDKWQWISLKKVKEI